MSTVVFDTSAVIALLRGEAGAALMAGRVGSGYHVRGQPSLVKALILRGLALPIIEEMVHELRLDLHTTARPPSPQRG